MLDPKQKHVLGHILDGVAFFPQAGHPSRRGEKGAVLEFVKKHFPTLKCVEMTGEGYMDGGDICFLGGESKISLPLFNTSPTVCSTVKN